MPLYEYKCDACGGVFEVLQKFSDEPLKTHDGCGGTVQRLLSPPAFQFKGTGWYVTDYARPNNGKSGPSESAAKSTSDAAGKAQENKKSEAPSSSTNK